MTNTELTHNLRGAIHAAGLSTGLMADAIESHLEPSLLPSEESAELTELRTAMYALSVTLIEFSQRCGIDVIEDANDDV